MNSKEMASLAMKEWICGILAGLRMLKEFAVAVTDDVVYLELRAQPELKGCFSVGLITSEADDAVVDRVEQLAKELKQRAV